MSNIKSLAQQILGHLQTATYTSDQLATMTGAHMYQVIDALTWLMGQHKIRQDVTPRYSLLKAGDSAAYAFALSPPSEALSASLQSPALSRDK